MAYTIKFGTATAKSLAYYQIEAAGLGFSNGGFDALNLTAAVELSDAFVAFGTEVKLYADGTCCFIGFVDSSDMTADTDEGTLHRYTCLSYLAKLEQYQYTQSVSAYDDDETTPTIRSYNDACVVLGRHSATSNVRNTTCAQIADILDYAINALSLPLSYDSANWPAGFNFPYDQRENISCWEGVVCMLRWMPDYILYCDYSSGTTVVKLAQADSLSASTLAAAGGGISSLSVRARNDLLQTGVNVFFRKTFTVDGKTRERRFVQSAGTNDARALNIYIDLEGAVTQTEAQEVTVAALPTLGSNPGFRAWLIDHAPWLSECASFTIDSVSRAGIRNFGNELISGSIQRWMNVDAEEDIITAKVSYTISSNGEAVEEATCSIPVAVTTTNATSKTYRRTVSYDSGEGIPTGLAAGIYSAWGRLHYDGSLTTTLENAGWIKPGKLLNISGSKSALASMNAIVQSAELNLGTGELSLEFGTLRALEADSMVSLYRAVRGRRYAWRIRTDQSGTAGDDSTTANGICATRTRDGQASPALDRTSLRIADSGKAFEMFPASDIVPTAALKLETDAATAGNVLKAREVYQLIMNAETGKLEAKPTMVFCSDSYGAPQEVGGEGATPEDPGDYAIILGSAGEGTEAELLDTWRYGVNYRIAIDDQATSQPCGLKLWIVSRVVYDESNSQILYGFKRLLTFSTSGLLYHVSEEIRFEIDTPVQVTI